jgi:hypothetical protein
MHALIRRHWRRLLLVLLLTVGLAVGHFVLLPLVIGAAVLLSALGQRKGFSIATLFSSIITGAFGIAATTLLVAIASRLYEQIGTQVKQPA